MSILHVRPLLTHNHLSFFFFFFFPLYPFPWLVPSWDDGPFCFFFLK